MCPKQVGFFSLLTFLVAHAWTGVEFAWSLTQDDAGRFELVDTAFKIIAHNLYIQIQTIWRRCWPDGLFRLPPSPNRLYLYTLFPYKAPWQLISRVSLSATSAVSSCFVGIARVVRQLPQQSCFWWARVPRQLPQKSWSCLWWRKQRDAYHRNRFVWLLALHFFKTLLFAGW